MKERTKPLQGLVRFFFYDSTVAAPSPGCLEALPHTEVNDNSSFALTQMDFTGSSHRSTIREAT